MVAAHHTDVKGGVEANGSSAWLHYIPGVPSEAAREHVPRTVSEQRCRRDGRCTVLTLACSCTSW